MSDRIESETEVKTYLDRLRYALGAGATIQFQEDRGVDIDREPQYTNRYTVEELFPNEDVVSALKRELRTLTVKNYIRTVPDTRFPKRSDWREFGKTYECTKEIYIKLRVELLGMSVVFVMSFHHSTIPFSETIFPYA